MKGHFVRVTSTTVSQTHVTMALASMELLATPATVTLDTQAIAVRTS